MLFLHRKRIQYTMMSQMDEESSADARIDSEEDSGIMSSFFEQSGYGSVPNPVTSDVEQDSVEAAATKDSAKHGFCQMKRDKKIIVTLLFSTRLLYGAYTMFMIPFFPAVGEEKGLSGAAIGFVLSCWDLFVVIFAPVAGALYARIGPKVLFCAGLLLAAISTLVFPLVEFAPPGGPYVAACVIIRLVGGMSGAAYKTAAYATLAKIFPDNVAAMFGTMETFGCIGYMVGPPLGGGLYQAGGFYLPFVVVGGGLAIVGILSIYCLPPLSASGAEHPEKSASFLPMLFQPVVLIIGFLIIVLGLSTTFIDLSMTIHLTNTFHLSPSLIGAVSLVYYTVLFALHPVWGVVADRLSNHNYHLASVAFLIMGLSQTFNGPAPFLHIKQQLWLNIVCQCIYCACIGSTTILFRTLNTAARNLGYKADSLEGMISSLYTLLFSVGAFFGPLVGGAFLDAVGFAWSSFIFACVNFFGALLLMLYIVTSPCSRSNQPVDRKRQDSETQPILYTKIETDENEESFMEEDMISDQIETLK